MFDGQTVHVDAFGATWHDDEVLADLFDALAAREEISGPVISADLERRSIGLTATVDVAVPGRAKSVVAAALGEALIALGLVEAWIPAGARPALIA